MIRQPSANTNERLTNTTDKGQQQGPDARPIAPLDVQLPAIGLPKGGGAIGGIEEKFQVHTISGTSSLSIPLPFSISRNGSSPGIGLVYSSGAGNSPFGLGWTLAVPSIKRKTAKGIPRYRDEIESDIFVLGGEEDLVPLLVDDSGNYKRHEEKKNLNGVVFTVKQYRPRIESTYACIERWCNNNTGETHWKTISPDNVHTVFGLTPNSRVSDPSDVSKIAEWLISQTYDDKGNISLFEYKREDFAGVPRTIAEKNRIGNCTQLYLKQILYGNKKPWYAGDPIPTPDPDPGTTPTPVAPGFLFRAVFDYGEHNDATPIPENIHTPSATWACRKDAFSSYRFGFEMRTYRRCRRVLMFHCFEEELPISPYLVKSLDLIYNDELNYTGSQRSEEGFSFLVAARQNGHRWDEQAGSYSTRSLPELEIVYQQHEWNSQVHRLSEDSAVHMPAGLQDKGYLWVDLFSEGISGILTEQGDALHYKHNLGNGVFSPALPVAPKPSFGGLARGTVALLDLNADGTKSLAHLNVEPKGFFKIDEDEEWQPLRYFSSIPNLDPSDTNMRPIDLTGDGRADILVSGDTSFHWYEGLGEEGFTVGGMLAKEVDEEKGPAIVFSDLTQSIFLTDMTGDGLMDIVRIRNGEVCYWPNKGYGRFGARVAMGNAPLFDHPDRFNPSWIRLADVDGSGTTDIVYLGRNDFRVWMNNSGNSWSSHPHIISAFPPVHNLSDVAVLDFLGQGTACIVYSTALGTRPVWYIDLMNGKKPHLYTSHKNNCGKEVFIEYRSSTQFYLDDKKQGKKWITKLPFPVHCVSKVRTEDKVRETVFTCSYKYSHGYYDNEEREFRGFGRVEQLDTDSFSSFRLNSARNVVSEELHQPPSRTITWFHTGAYIRNRKILHQYEEEYFRNPAFSEYNMPDTALPPSLAGQDLKEALRACKGMALRIEVYGTDDAPQKDFPFYVSQSNGTIRQVQPRALNRFGSYQKISGETITYSYERNPADPRIAHSFVLETDELGNMLKNAGVVYKRLQRPSGNQAIPDKVWEQQNTLHVVYGEFSYTPDVVTENVYRLRAGYQTKSYELGGIDIPNGQYLSTDVLKNHIQAATEILFEEEFSSGAQKRLSGFGRKYFLKDDLSGPLNLGELSTLGIVHKTYQLVYTTGLVNKYYGGKVDDPLLSGGGYVHLEGDAHWWVGSGEFIFPANPGDHFYVPIGSRDIFGNEAGVSYDPHCLLIESATDAMGNTVQSVNDYRVLDTVMLTDANLNRSAVAIDELGQVIKSAVMGKSGSPDGDTLDDPTARIEYDLFNWKNNSLPNYTHAFQREQHGVAGTRWVESYAYSDGSGSVIMTKEPAPPGTARRWNSDTEEVEEVHADPRWRGNGRTIFNNKGQPIKKYEPYFSATHEYEKESALVESGISATLFYDVQGRNIRTEYPNGSFAKITFTPWWFASYDVNDTVRESQWYADRGSPDPDNEPEPTDPERRAAWLAAKHANTPSRFHMDGAGKPLVTVADYGGGKTTAVFVDSDPMGRESRSYDQLDREISYGAANIIGSPIYSKTAEKGENWIFSDAAGRLCWTWNNDARTFRFEYDALHRPVSSFVDEGNGELLYNHIVYGDIFADASNRNLVGRAYQLYDQSGVTTSAEIDFKGNLLKAERKLANNYKTTINWQPLHGLNTAAAISLAAAPFLEDETFTSSTQFDALNRPVNVVLPDQSVAVPEYNIAGGLGTLQVKLRGEGAFIDFLEKQEYNARGQRLYARYGNGLTTSYYYDPLTLKLNRITTQQQGAPPEDFLQDISYTFDPVGNIVHVRDDAQQTYFFQNTVVEPENRFVYDALYQLISATGREHGSAGALQRTDADVPFYGQLPHNNDLNAVKQYTENYTYDELGNILRLQHQSGGTNWYQRYRYQYQDDPANNTNRLQAVSMPGDTEAGPFSGAHQYDQHGNAIVMPHLASLSWNFMSQLQTADLGGGGKAYYVYDKSGHRIRKIIERPGGKKLERIYLGVVEIYREYQGGTKKLERNTLRVADHAGTIAQVDTKLIDTDNADPGNALLKDLVRYQYSNHLGSATMETDENGVMVSYEEYHPFGTSAFRIHKPGVDISLKRYRFSGKEKDEETAFFYFGARYYAPWLCRWISSDPAGFADGVSLYVYCRNNPVMVKDPSGMEGNPDLVAATPDTERLRDPARSEEAKAYLERVYTSRLRDDLRGTNRFVIDVMHFDSSTRRWIVDEFHVESVGSSDDPPPAGEAGGQEGGIKGGVENGVVTATPPTPDGTTSTEGSIDGVSPDGSPDGSVDGSPDGSPNGSLDGSPDGSPNGSVNGSPTGNGSGGGPPRERTWWDRGGSVILAGALLLAAGLFTIFTAGAGTPLLILAMGYMSAAGGVIMLGGGMGLMGASYSGYTTAEEDRAVSETLHDVGALSSPFGLVGGGVGYAIDGREGMRTGALVGNVTHLGHGLARYGMARAASGSARELSSDANLVNSMNTLRPTVPAGNAVIGSHGTSGAFQTTAGAMAPIADLAPTIQAAPHGSVTILACNVGQDAAAAQALANQTGRSVRVFSDIVGANNFNQVWTYAPTATGLTHSGFTTGTTFLPQYLSPFLNLSPNIAAPAANISSEAARPR